MTMYGDAVPRILAQQAISIDGLTATRHLVLTLARGAGLREQRAHNLALAVDEAATNTIRFADATGHLELTHDGGHLVSAEVTDHGPGLPESHPGGRPPPGAIGGRGLWLIHQLCDRVVIRTGANGTALHLEMQVEAQPGERA